MMKFFKTHFASSVILIIFAAGIYFRSTWYGDLRLSTANAETHSYVTSSRAPLVSWKTFAGQRPLTSSLVYKFASDETNCPIISFSKPGIGEEVEREIQPCFDKIALLQNWAAIFGWCFLGWMLARRLQNPFVKIAAATLVMLFGFTPQIAEWDSVLSPESLSLSLFAVTLGLGLELAFRAANSEAPFNSRVEKLLLSGFVIVFLLWVFVRDVHLYAIPITLLLLIPFFFSKKLRESKALIASFLVLLIFFIIGFLSARDGRRATVPLGHAIEEYILPHPSRVEYLRRFGMPEASSPDFMPWVDDLGAKAYGLFLVSHPGFVFTTLWDDMELLASDFIQPYFLTDEIKHRDVLLVVGEMVNPETGAIYLLILLILTAFFTQSVSTRTPASLAWTWLALWVIGAASVTLVLGYFGDTGGLRRHIMPSVEMFRLCLWVFLFPFLDLSLGE